MQSSFARAATLVLSGTLGAALFASPALADTIPFTRVSLTTISPVATTPTSDLHVQSGSTPPGRSATELSSSGAWGAASASGYSSIHSGSLGGHASVTFDDGTPYVYSQFFASLGEGFRSYDDTGDPFDWAGHTATFTMDIHGDIFAPSNIDGFNAWVALILYEPGTMSPDSLYFNDEHKIAHYLFHVGRPDQHTYFAEDGQQVEVFPTAYVGDPSPTVRIDQVIDPGSDFDWIVVMYASTVLANPGTLSVDMSNTLTLGFTGPAGATTTSVSGAFTSITNVPGTDTGSGTVPEPATMALLGCGVVGLAARRRLARV